METEKVDITASLARTIASIEYDSFASQKGVVEAAKLNVLDTLGVTLAGSTLMEGSKGLAETIADAGGKQESTILALGKKVPAWSAAFANGLMVHCLDYDDVHDPTALHPSSPTIPAALAMAERVGNVSGKDFLGAVILGGDLICKLGLSLAPRWQNRVRDWMLTQTLGPFSATAAAGRLAGLDGEKMAEAMGIAFTYCSGTNELLQPGATIRGFYSHVPALAGILSVLMVQNGVTGMKAPLEGKFGLYNMYFGGEYDRNPLDNYGKTLDYPLQVGIKPWAACRQSHTFIQATLDIMAEHNIQPEQVASITAFVGEQGIRLCQPPELRQRPQTIMDAKFSIPWCIACAAARGTVTLNDFTLESLANPENRARAARVNYKFDEEVNVIVGVPPGKVEIETKTGAKFRALVRHSLGSPQNKMTPASAIAKFHECASHSSSPLSRAKQEQIVETVLDLDNISDMDELLRLFRAN